MSTISIPRKDLDDDEDQNGSQDNIDQTSRSRGYPALNSDNENNDQGLLSDANGFVNQGSQAVLTYAKLKKRTKSSHSKKAKSSSPRSNGFQISSSTSQNRVSSHSDLINFPVPMKASTSISKKPENNGFKRSITIDTSKARSNLEVVRLCLRELKWKECSNETTLDSDIYWHASSFHEGNTNFGFSSGRVNKFPGMNDLLRKVHLTRLLNNMRLLFPNEYDFYPKTWFLPEQNQQFKDDIRYIHQLDEKHNRSLTTFIIKPSDGSQGEGIYLLRDPSHMINTKRPHVAQEYIDRPLLIDGLKFDLRIYVLILNLYPLEIFLYNEGLVRFATVDYKAPSTENLHETYMHLTNYSLNRHSVNYKHTTDDKQKNGSKRKLSLVWKQLSQIFGNEKIERTKNLIIELVNKTILAVTPELRVEYEFELPLRKNQNISCFQIIGFDIILNEQLKPILLEVNANPSLRIDFDKENEEGKLVCQPSPVDEEIKKPLVLETLKLALPKKKLNRIARHAENQVNDKKIAQQIEKVAQRRLDERNEKMKNERESRFDLRLNPFFSRPLRSKPKQSINTQKNEEEELHSSSPARSDIIAESQEDLTAYTLVNTNHNESIKYVRKFIKKPKKLRCSTGDDDNESGSPTTAVIETFSSLNLNRPSTLSGLIRPIITTTDTTVIRSTDTLKLIFSPNHQTKYEYLFLVDKIADIFIQFVAISGYKTMTSGQFRSFANTCEIIDETITSSSIDILYYQMLKKWQQFVLRTTSTGLPFPAFIEAFFCLSQRKFPNAANLFDCVDHLVSICTDHLNSTSRVASSPLIPQSDQYVLRRTTKNNNTIDSSSSNIRTSITKLRSLTTAPIRRSLIATLSTSALKNHSEQITPSIKNIDDKTKSNTLKPSTKSVFPLFFDVL